ncbi:hypothetical protein [Methanogenium sp. MK-MG]|uniref:hypothetical protein n=1 Tax=Methanogenium sp. MK-MG TaxID=2599926 RepID=UPI0013ECA29D|nr:hypothetical protein [Methanogenium sp. MK-MG]
MIISDPVGRHGLPRFPSLFVTLQSAGARVLAVLRDWVPPIAVARLSSAMTWAVAVPTAATQPQERSPGSVGIC